MPNSENIKLTGFFSLVLISILLIATLCGSAAYLLPKQSTPNIDLTKHAKQLAEPLTLSINDGGESQVVNILSSISEANPNIDYYLYSMSRNSDSVLVYQSDDNPIAPITQAKQFQVGNTLTVHQPLKPNGQYIGELIVKYQPTVSNSSAHLAYALFVLAIVLSVVLTIFSRKRLAQNLANDQRKLKLELQKVSKEQDYKRFIDSNLDFGLDEVAKSINDVLEQVQSSLDNNHTSEKELKQLQTSLETEVQARTLALEKATMNAERANDAKTTFLATMSHEIRTPMNGVIGTIDLLRQTDLDGAQHRLSTIIRDSAFSLLGILDDILDFSKIEAGKLQIDNTVFSVTDTIEEVARVLSSVAKKRKLDLQLSIAPDIPKNLVGDNIRVRQVLYNLCSNAIKFTTTDEKRQGFVKITVEVAQNTSEHYTLRFSVTDNGKGMSQIQLREIFNPFIQAENSITREYGGTGLGLSICKSLIELMLGSINVTSDLGMGSEFVVELPFSTDGKVEYVNKSVMGQKPVVVLTENASRKSVLARYLSFMGANSYSISNIDEAEEFQHTSELIWILDGLNGMAPVNDQLRSLLYSLEQNKQQVIVLSTMDESALNHSNIFYLNAAPLCKNSFMTSVMVAAGLHKPKQLKKAKSLNNFLNVDKARAANKLVLLAEDNILNQQVLTDQLHLLGYGVEVAENGEEGLAMWKENHYPIILTDLHMPKMSGYDMVKAIRSEAEKSDDIKAQPYIIAVTANALKGEKERCIATGMNDYITKPIELNVLESTLGKWQPEKHVQVRSQQNIDDAETHDKADIENNTLNVDDVIENNDHSPQSILDAEHNDSGDTSEEDQNITPTNREYSDTEHGQEVNENETSDEESALLSPEHDLTTALESVDELQWQGDSEQNDTALSQSDEIDLSHIETESSNLEWQDNESGKTAISGDEDIPEIDLDNIETDAEGSLNWQDMEVESSSEDMVSNSAPDINSDFESTSPDASNQPVSSMTGSLSSISLETSWEAHSNSINIDGDAPTSNLSLAPEGTSQDVLNPALNQEAEVSNTQDSTIEDTGSNTDFEQQNVDSGELDGSANNNDAESIDIQSLPVVDVDMFDKYVNHDEAKKVRFFRMYLEQSSELIRNIFSSVMTREQENIISDCHQLKSISKTVGAMQVAEIAIAFEEACKARDLTIDELISFRDRLDDIYTDAMMFIQDFIKQHSD